MRFIGRIILALAVLFLTESLQVALLASEPDEPRHEQEFIKSFAFEPGGQLNLQNVVGSIQVSSWDQDSVQVQVVKTIEKVSDPVEARRWLDTLKIGIERTGNTVNITTVYPERLEINADDGWIRTFLKIFKFPKIEGERIALKANYTVKVPARTSVSLNLGIGELEVSGLDGDVQAATSFGEIKINKIKGNVRVQAKAGEIAVKEVTGSAETEVSIGEITLEGVTGAVTAESRIGEITIALPEPVSGKLDVSTGIGEVNLDLDSRIEGRISKRKIEGGIGGGGSLIKASTSIGDITLKKAQ